TDDAIREIAHMAYLMNEQTENIGARRLHTIIEKLLEDISYNLPDPEKDHITIDKDYVDEKFNEKIHPVELEKYII
ncbi:MAG: HslU--HslV peptidase ATPase subunit, partial [Anaerovoracaceae bacterium]|nr:HslU--HslV peptidase ATPase subunit [Anaerovoracaceae bacterium]